MYIDIRQALRKSEPICEFRLNDEFASLIYHPKIRASLLCGKGQTFRKLTNAPKPWGDDHFPGTVNTPPLVADPNSGKPFGKFIRKLKLRGNDYISSAIYVSVLTSY